jgi:hypothetical protein
MDFVDSTLAMEPMERVGTDMFHHKGGHFLFTVDEYSELSWSHRFAKTPDTKKVIQVQTSWFRQTGFPKYLRHDF